MKAIAILRSKNNTNPRSIYLSRFHPLSFSLISLTHPSHLRLSPPQYLEAIAMLRSKNITFPRSIHLTVVPDEETGGVDGMGRLVRSEVFRGLGVGCAMDEGLASEDEGFSAFYSERAIWNVSHIFVLVLVAALHVVCVVSVFCLCSVCVLFLHYALRGLGVGPTREDEGFSVSASSGLFGM